MTSAPYVLRVPSGWTLLSTEDIAAETRIGELLAEQALTPAQLAVYEASLRDADGIARTLKPGHRVNYVLVVDQPELRADALLSVRVTKVVPEAYDEYLAAVEASAQTDPRIEAINRTVEEVELGNGRAVVVSDIIALGDQRGVIEASIERGIAAVFVRDAPLLLEVYVATRNLARFPSIRDYALDVAAAYRPDGEEAA